MPTLLLLCLLSVEPAQVADTVVVCPVVLREALAPWVAHRESQGHQLALVSSDGGADEIRDRIRAVADGGQLSHVVLVGDADPSAEYDQRVRDRCVPTFQVRARVNVKWGSEPWIGTDNPYGDLDGDRLPDVAVGRLTADTPGQLQSIVGKILAYEKSTDMRPWRRRVNFVAGVGGFGMLADMMLETAAKKIIRDGVPDAYETTMTYGSWRSPYCPDPRNFHLITQRRLDEGSLFWVYIGHGQRTLLDRVRTPAGTHHILGVRDAQRLNCEAGAPIALLLACYAGAFDDRHDCLAERMLSAPNGPVAVYCGSRVTMPYAMSVMAMGLMDEVFRQRTATLGDVVLHGKRRLVSADEESVNRRRLDALAATLSPAPADLAGEREEHVQLFNLIGDPLLRLRYPQEVAVATAEYGTSGQSLTVSIASPVKGRATVELVCRRDRLTFDPPSRTHFHNDDATLSAMNEVYHRANDSRWTVRSITVGEQPVTLDLDIPATAHGLSHVRVYVEGRDAFAAGATDVYLRRPPAATASTPAPPAR